MNYSPYPFTNVAERSYDVILAFLVMHINFNTTVGLRSQCPVMARTMSGHSLVNKKLGLLVYSCTRDKSCDCSFVFGMQGHKQSQSKQKKKRDYGCFIEIRGASNPIHLILCMFNIPRERLCSRIDRYSLIWLTLFSLYKF